MRRFIQLIVVLALGVGAFYYWNEGADLRHVMKRYVENGEFLTLEAKYTPEQIMEKHRKELLVDDQHTFQEAALKFYPFLLIEAKYSQLDKKTKESLVLWGLVDGEMVIDTDSWETTHGFADAIDAGSSRSDFRVMMALAKNKGVMSRDQLQKELQVDNEVLNGWIDGARQKYLVVLTGNEVRLHFEDPKILVSPQSKITQAFVTKPYSQIQTLPSRYSRAQVEKIALAAFGSDFMIRQSKDLFLPVYAIEVLNPDGSVRTSYWNALTGLRINSTVSNNAP